MNLKIDFDFEELDKLPIEEYNKLEDKYLNYAIKLWFSSRKDYLKKKGLKLKDLTFEQHRKMENALNRRKAIKATSQNVLMFNKCFRSLVGDTRR